MAWNPNVPNERRIVGKMTPGRPLAPSHVVCHITGTDSFEDVRREFTSNASAHYVIDKEGRLYQFVEEDNRAWHAGIKVAVQAQYDKGGTDWRKLLYHFSWAVYPAAAIWLDATLAPVTDRSRAVFVARPDGAEWDEYRCFRERWGNEAGPIAIEILSVGARTASPTAYTDRMYETLVGLVGDICVRHHIPQEKGRVVGHEDVNPLQRYGWDPNQGFD
jgi:N-acetyl-anhydromuramyl-L-alanine amidase AmpD